MRERTIFLTAQAIDDPVKRREYLDGVCGRSGAQRDRIEALLRSSESVGNFLEGNTEAFGHRQTSESFVAPVTDASAVTTDNPTVGSDVSGDSAAAIDLHFLKPTDVPGSLGRVGHYEIVELLGRGGFGMVFRAADPRLGRDVAIKVLMPHFAITSPPRKRFLREARACAAIRHPNVVHVYGVEDDPLPAIVMELIEGTTLQQELDEQGPLEIQEVLRIATSLADGLAAAHRCDLVHRDLKPSNIQIERGGLRRVILTDFGLARTVDDASLTQTGAVAGTPMYMAPEQATGKSVDGRADLFSFGSVLYVMVTGRPAFRGPTSMAVMQRVAHATPRSIQELAPDCPVSLCRLIERLLAKSPDDRIQTADQLHELLVGISDEPAVIPTEILPVLDRPARPQGYVGWRAMLLVAVPLFLLGLILIARGGWGAASLSDSTPQSTVRQAPAKESGLVAELDPVQPVVTNPWASMPPDAPPPAMAPFDAKTAVEHQRRWADYLSVPFEFTDPRGINFRLVPPGQFAMGSSPDEIKRALKASTYRWRNVAIEGEGPVRQVALTQPFYIATTEMTQLQFESVMSLNPSRYSQSGYRSESVDSVDTDSMPAESMSYNDAFDCIGRLNQCYGFASPGDSRRDWIDQVRPAIGYRFPTEAEWEFACRAGTTTSYWTGDDPQLLSASENLSMSNRRPWVVKSGEANPFGLYDMHGNVMEFVADFYDPARIVPSARPRAGDGDLFRINPLTEKSGQIDQSIFRGGDYYYPRVMARSACWLSEYRYINPEVIVGIRLSMSVETARRLQQRDVSAERKVSSFREIHGASREELDQWIRQLQGNHVPIAMNIRHGDDRNLVDAVAIDRTALDADGNTDWQVKAPENDVQSGLDFQERRDNWGEVWRLCFPESDRVPLECNVLSLWRSTGTVWGTWNLLQKDPASKLTLSCQDGWIPVSVCRIRSGDIFNTHYMHIRAPGVGCHSYPGLTLDEFKAKVDFYRKRDWRPSLMQANMGTDVLRIACTFRENSDAAKWSVSYGLSTEEFEDQVKQQRLADFYPASFLSQVDRGEVSFVVLWRSMVGPADIIASL